MELEPVDGSYLNGFGETVELENEYVYPLLKSSDVGNSRANSYRKVVLVTQKCVGEDTAQIRTTAPGTWRYLVEHRECLDGRKSSIYKGKPDFSVFGVGQYSFKR